MTLLGELPATRTDLDPRVPFPPFPIWLRLPSDWSCLDTHPATWEAGARGLVDRTFGGARLPSRERRAVLGVVEDLVADCQRAGAALSLVTLGRLPDGGPASAGIHLAFAGDERPASLGRVRDMIPRSGSIQEVPSPAGTGLLHTDRMTMMVPGTATVKTLTSLQFFLPFPGSNWTMVVSTASASAGMTAPLTALLRSIGESVRLTAEPPMPTGRPGPGGGGSVSGPADAGQVRYQRAELPHAPGTERGFGTLVVQRLGGPDQQQGTDGDAVRLPAPGAPGV